jgi:hypothetical protein
MKKNMWIEQYEHWEELLHLCVEYYNTNTTWFVPTKTSCAALLPRFENACSSFIQIGRSGLAGTNLVRRSTVGTLSLDNYITYWYLDSLRKALSLPT